MSDSRQQTIDNQNKSDNQNRGQHEIPMSSHRLTDLLTLLASTQHPSSPFNSASSDSITTEPSPAFNPQTHSRKHTRTRSLAPSCSHRPFNTRHLRRRYRGVVEFSIFCHVRPLPAGPMSRRRVVPELCQAVTRAGHEVPECGRRGVPGEGSC